MKNVRFISVTALASLLSTALVFQACVTNDEENHYPVPSAQVAGIENSPEMEAFIIAAVDYRQAYLRFQKQIKAIDFSKLETINDNGVNVKSLPDNTVDIVGKLSVLKDKTNVLLTKYPEFSRMSGDVQKSYIRTCIQNSAVVNDALLSLQGNRAFSRGDIKVDWAEEFGKDDGDELVDYLEDWCSDDNSWRYEEIWIVTLEDGTSIVASTSEADETSTSIQLKADPVNKRYYFEDYESPVVTLAHTHTGSSMDTTTDETFAKQCKEYNVTLKIFYNGEFHPVLDE